MDAAHVFGFVIGAWAVTWLLWRLFLWWER